MTSARLRPYQGGALDIEVDSATVFWSIRDIQRHCRIGRTTAWKLVKDPGFPAPVIVGKRKMTWPVGEVIQFLETLRQPDHYLGSKARTTNSALIPHDYRVREVRTRRPPLRS